MNKEKTREKIIKVIRKTFTVTDEDFVSNEGYAPIEMSTNFQNGSDWKDHQLFASQLADALNKAFPNHDRKIMVDGCDKQFQVCRELRCFQNVLR
jgi:hypothetical protein